LGEVKWHTSEVAGEGGNVYHTHNLQCPVRVESLFRDDDERIIAAWNTRSSDPQLAALQWTSVEERLPDYGVPVLIVYHGVVQNTLYVRDVGEWRSASDDESDHMPESFASHWMPKPAPPDPSGVQGKENGS